MYSKWQLSVHCHAPKGPSHEQYLKTWPPATLPLRHRVGDSDVCHLARLLLDPSQLGLLVNLKGLVDTGANTHGLRPAFAHSITTGQLLTCGTKGEDSEVTRSRELRNSVRINVAAQDSRLLILSAGTVWVTVYFQGGNHPFYGLQAKSYTLDVYKRAEKYPNYFPINQEGKSREPLSCGNQYIIAHFYILLFYIASLLHYCLWITTILFHPYF